MIAVPLSSAVFDDDGSYTVDHLTGSNDTSGSLASTSSLTLTVDAYDIYVIRIEDPI